MAKRGNGSGDWTPLFGSNGSGREGGGSYKSGKNESGGKHYVSKDKENEDKDQEREYLTVAHSIVSSMRDERSQKAASQILLDENGKTRTIYREMREAGLEPQEASVYLAHGLNEIGEGKNISYKSFARAVADDIANQGDYFRKVGDRLEVLEQLYNEKVIDESTYKKTVDEIKSRAGEKGRRISSRLEGLAKAAVWLFIAIGAIIMLLSGVSTTGAVIGSSKPVESAVLFVIGFVLFVMGLVLNFREK